MNDKDYNPFLASIKDEEVKVNVTKKVDKSTENKPKKSKPQPKPAVIKLVKKQPKKVNFALRISEETNDKIISLSEESNFSKNEIINMALEEYLK